MDEVITTATPDIIAALEAAWPAVNIQKLRLRYTNHGGGVCMDSVGFDLSATGTGEALVAAGLIGAEDIPAGRSTTRGRFQLFRSKLNLRLKMSYREHWERYGGPVNPQTQRVLDCMAAALWSSFRKQVAP